MHRQYRLAEGGRVGQGTEAGQIEADDRHDRQVLELIGTLVVLGPRERVRSAAARPQPRRDERTLRPEGVQRVEGEGSMDAVVMQADAPCEQNEHPD